MQSIKSDQPLVSSIVDGHASPNPDPAAHKTVDLAAIVAILEAARASAKSSGASTATMMLTDLDSTLLAIEDSQAKLQEIGETISSGWINLAGFGDPEYTGLAVPVKDIKDILDGGDYPITSIFFDAYLKALAEQDALREEIRLLHLSGAVVFLPAGEAAPETAVGA